MLIIGGLASGPQIAPTVPPEKYGQAAIAFIVRDRCHSTITLMADYHLIVHSAYMYSHLTCPGVLLHGPLRPRCV
jgi:hypothetical protein